MLTKDGKPWGEYECELVINGGKTAAWCRLGGFLRELVSLDTGSPICVLSEGRGRGSPARLTVIDGRAVSPTITGRARDRG